MQVSGEIIFLGLAIGVYIFILLDRICKCFEICAQHKMMSGMYTNIDPVIYKQTLESKLKEK